jgi:multiple sugar transport system ATP-binding protein
MAEVVLKGITKIYDSGLPVVNNIDVKISDKEFVVLVGPSGCGKSTTLRMIAGLEEITSGDLFIDGKKVNDIPPKNRDIAMVFQNYALYPHMTVYENMAFGLKLRKYDKEEIKKRVTEAAKILDLEAFLDRKPRALSGGQRQRVAVGRAIVRKPKVFLFDEPLSNLDAKLRVQMRTEISKLHKKLDATMIYVTHDQTEAMTMGDRIVVMKDGLVQQIETPMNLYSKPVNKFVAGFIGSPAMNFIKGKIVAGSTSKFISDGNSLSLDIPLSQFDSLKAYQNKSIYLGIRPENISDSPIPNNSTEAEVKIDVVEPMGNEIFLYFQVDNEQFICRKTTSDLPAPGSMKKLYFDLSKLHFFDSETEQAI